MNKQSSRYYLHGIPAPQTAPARLAEVPSPQCQPEHTDPKEGIYVRVKSDRNQRLATSPLMAGVNAAIEWARGWNDENSGFTAVVEILRDGRVYRRYERKRTALAVVG
jgi:hypothetical protein